jgi:hypothetical protein
MHIRKPILTLTDAISTEWCYVLCGMPLRTLRRFSIFRISSDNRETLSICFRFLLRNWRLSPPRRPPPCRAGSRRLRRPGLSRLPRRDANQRPALHAWQSLIRNAISQAFDAVASTMPLGSVHYEQCSPNSAKPSRMVAGGAPRRGEHRQTLSPRGYSLVDVLRLVEQSHLPARRALEKLGIRSAGQLCLQ